MLENGIRFTKMQAFGNDFVYIDATSQTIADPATLALQMSDRRYGVGADGLVLVCPSDCADFRMRIFNHDGSEAEMCGNAIRGAAKFIYNYGLTDRREMKIETLAGTKSLYLEVTGGAVTNITAEIGYPDFTSEKIPVITDGPTFIGQSVLLQDRAFETTAISLGNPFCASFVDDILGFDLAKYGPLMETHELFPRKINAIFCEVIERNRLRLRTWERNTGETMACGLGCCTSVVAGTVLGLCNPVADVEQLGGVTHIEWENGKDRLFMTGPSEIVFEGVWRVSHSDTGAIDRKNKIQNFAGRD